VLCVCLHGPGGTCARARLVAFVVGCEPLCIPDRLSPYCLTHLPHTAIAGALIGAFLNKILPELLLTVLLVVLLSFTAWNTLKKAIKMYRKESLLLRESELSKLVHDQDDDAEEEAEDTLLDHMEETALELKEGVAVEMRTEAEGLLAAARHEKERATILEEERHTPQGNLMVLVTLFVVVLAINLLKGGGAFPSPLGIVCGSTGFWASNFIMLAWILVISIMVRYYLVQRHEQKESCGYPYVEGDIKWDARATIVYPFVCCFAGFFAGMFGGKYYVGTRKTWPFLVCLLHGYIAHIDFYSSQLQWEEVSSRVLSCW
jgi:hypothetical protein